MVKKICLGDFLVDYFTKSYQQNQNGSLAWIDVISLSNLAGNNTTYYQADKSKPVNLCVQLYSDYYGILKKKF